MAPKHPSLPEPVPFATQLAVLPHLAALHGFLSSYRSAQALRLTVHRTIRRDDGLFLQQACSYFGTQSGVGRIYPVDTGVIGASFRERKVFRTKAYSSEESLIVDLKRDMEDTKDERPLASVAKSYLAIPVLGQFGSPVLILYADSMSLNYFSEAPIEPLASMVKGFCSLFDILEEMPFPTIRNFPLEFGSAVEHKAGPTVYPRIQESLQIDPPHFTRISSFNYEAVVE